MNDKISDILLAKAKNDQLHNLYLIEPNRAEFDGITQAWTYQLIQKMLDVASLQSLDNKEDFLRIVKNPENKKYIKTDIDPIFSFVRYKSSQYFKKILVIENAADLSEIHINKLLKTFEEPPIPLCIFLVNSAKANLMGTLYSRSIKLQIPLVRESEQPSSWSELKKCDFFDFTQRVEKEQLDIAQLVGLVYHEAQSGDTTPETLLKIQSTLQQLELDQTYHNSKQGRLFKIHSCLQLL